MPVKFIRNDITRVKADVIVNSANPNPTYGAGMDSAIYLAAGKEKLLEARKKIGEIKPGDVEYNVNVPNIEKIMNWYRSLIGKKNEYSYADYGICISDDFEIFYSK